MTELGVVLMLATIGWVVVAGAERRAEGWHYAAALPAGAAVVVGVELALLATGLPIARPLAALAVSGVGAVSLARRRQTARPTWRPLASALAAAVAIVAATAWLPVANVSADSFRYVTLAELLARTGDVSLASAFLLHSRALALGTLHGLSVGELPYLRSLTPLVAASTLAALWVLARQGLSRLPAETQRLVAGGGVLLLASNHRFVFNAFYLNGHMLFAAWALLAAGIVLRRGRRSHRGEAPESFALSAVCSGIVVLRPEGLLVVGLLIAPYVLDHGLPARHRRAVLLAVGIATLLWHLAVVTPAYMDEAREVPGSLWGMALIGIASVALSAAIPWLDRLRLTRPLVWLHAGAWALVVALAVRDPGILFWSTVATLRNVVWQGRWGVSLLLLATLLAVGIMRRTFPGDRELVFVLATFVPLSAMLAFLRGGPYRVGPGDSLNRMLLHILPIAVLTLVLAADSEPRVLGQSRNEA